jgi:hypothetical protein
MKSWITVQLHQKSQVKPMIPMTPKVSLRRVRVRVRDQNGLFILPDPSRQVHNCRSNERYWIASET